MSKWLRCTRSSFRPTWVARVTKRRGGKLHAIDRLDPAKTALNATPKQEDVPKKEGPETPPDSPLLDLSDAAVKKLISRAKKRGYVTHDQINSLLSSEEVNSEQIEDILAMFSEMGVKVVETEDAKPEDEGPREEPEEEPESEHDELIEIQHKVAAKVATKEPTERTDGPVRMYLREMGTMELLSCKGEIAIAKRIEAGREAMIAGLCESPLTFQAIIIWRDELNEGKVSLRDIINLEATYADPDAKASGNQPTASDVADLIAVGKSCGYTRAKWVATPEEMAREAADAIRSRELTMLGVKTDLGGADVPEFQMPELKMKFRFIRHIEKTEKRSILSAWSAVADGRPK
jgi:Sigma-70 factor, region 1.1/Sigma-70 factor, region 1.2